MRAQVRMPVVVAALVLAGCGTPDSSGDKDAGGFLPDASSVQQDSGSPHDAGAGLDASSAQLDAGAPQDAGLTQADASQPEDAAGLMPDSGSAQDAANCVPVSPGPGGMDPGTNCMSCHGYLSVAGTVYSSASGGKPVVGATVRITGADGGVLELVTGQDGIFSTGQPVAFPAKVSVSKCPDTSTMPSTITSGECSATGCHDNSAPVHLP